jgi:predicted nucleic acid-binding Zn ribbon protein
MEVASKLIRGIRVGGEAVSDEQLARAAWPRSVGPKIAAHTRAARMVRTRLVVEVEDHVWQLQLNTLRGQILRSMERSLGAGVVEDVEFRIVPRRIDAQRATVSAPSLLPDEAEGIPDPVMRSIYRASRKRAQA